MAEHHLQRERSLYHTSFPTSVERERAGMSGHDWRGSDVDFFFGMEDMSAFLCSIKKYEHGMKDFSHDSKALSNYNLDRKTSQLSCRNHRWYSIRCFQYSFVKHIIEPHGRIELQVQDIDPTPLIGRRGGRAVSFTPLEIIGWYLKKCLWYYGLGLGLGGERSFQC